MPCSLLGKKLFSELYSHGRPFFNLIVLCTEQHQPVHDQKQKPLLLVAELLNPRLRVNTKQ